MREPRQAALDSSSEDARRLHQLLRANLSIIGELTLASALRRIIEAACELAGAKYGALGVIGAGDQLEEFIHTGVDQVTAERIGPLPRGRGLLGALIHDPHPIRLDELSADPRSSGFPAGHPPMRSFLGVPIRVRDQVFGNLYLSERVDGLPFSSADERIVTALAATAGVVVMNARLYEDSRLRQRWLAASEEITRQLLSGEGEEPLRLVARAVHEVAAADVVTVALPTGDASRLMIEVAVGMGAQQLTAVSFAVEDSFAGDALRTGESRRIDEVEVTEYPLHLSRAVDVGAILVVPLVGFGRVRGALTVGRVRGRAGFSSADLDMVTVFANHAAIALELDDARTDQQRVALLEDRDRIARDLHDHVIQSLFAIGLSTQSVAASMPAGPQQDRLAASVEDIDATIRQIRTSIFQLAGALIPERATLRARLLAIVLDLERALGFRPTVEFLGPIDFAVDAAIAEDLVAVCREGLSNVARHARASTAQVVLSATVDQVVLVVQDDGIGIGEVPRPSGLHNMRDRAERHGGTFSIESTGQSGTRLRWSVPALPLPAGELR